MVRIVENNDWVIFIILATMFVFIVVLQYLQRTAGLKDFFLQAYEETANVFASWGLVSLVFVVLLAALASDFVLVLPKEIEQISLLGYSLNKMGYSLLVLSGFYLVRYLLTALFYLCTNDGERLSKLQFVSAKFYFIIASLLILGNFINYYLDINPILVQQVFPIATAVVIGFKVLFFIFNRNEILPKLWYYKILYICTLQFPPILAVWKLLFF
ncbi:MAG: DUF4271 domain-containing protein [Bergeyella zoohelcum]|nr:DUF4271 domain-containing protein [Bergeyella zoohelcum]